MMRAGFVSIIGRPNTGKSTLLNKILKINLSAVSPKAQTTRARVQGIYMDDESQIIFYDTPGMISAENKMENQMVGDIRQSISDSDMVLYLVDDYNFSERIPQIEHIRAPLIVCLNKIDKIDDGRRQLISDVLSEEYPDAKKTFISAMTGEGIDELISVLKTMLPHENAFYPEDMITDKPERFFAAEYIREQIFKMYGAEIPYSCGVIIEDFTERDNRKVYVRANIYVERDSQKAILIGAKGLKIKQVGVEARLRIEELIEKPVFLELNVKVNKNWKENPIMIKRMWEGT